MWGTTSLYNALILHPQICQCIVKEPQWYASGHRLNIGRDTGTYGDLWAGYHEMHQSFYDNISDYELQLSYYRKLFNQDQILVLNFYDLINENFDFKLIWDFLEIDNCDITLLHLNKSDS